MMARLIYFAPASPDGYIADETGILIEAAAAEAESGRVGIFEERRVHG